MTQKREDLLNMLCDLSDLSALIAGSDTIEAFLRKTVELVSRHLGTPVCSIYLYDEAADELVLRATKGLNPAAVDKVRMAMGQGLVGMVAQTKQPVREGHASKNPHFRYFPETDELRYESFLAVPIQKGAVRIGVLVVQHTQIDYFENSEEMALKATSVQLASVLENARLLMDLQRMCGIPEKQPLELGFIKGRRASGGIALAPASVWRKSHGSLLDTDDTDSGSMTDFNKAVKRTVEQLEVLQNRCAERLPESAALIFAAHFMILKDPKFIDRMREEIRSGASATRAVREVARHYIRLFAESPHPYIREKVSDLEDLSGRLLSNLHPAPEESVGRFSGRVILAGELYPSELLKLAAEDIAAIVLAGGGTTSHVAIICRALKIPMVLAGNPDLLKVPDNTQVLVDGEVGNVYVNPSEDITQRFDARHHAGLQMQARAGRIQADATRTLDGKPIGLHANINLLSELPVAVQMRVSGIGLYRTEFPFLVRPAIPSETEQYLVYRRVVEAMGEKPVVFRTLDVGGEKTLTYTDMAKEANPEMGLRAVRFTLAYPEIFQQQIRAILRAAASAVTVGIMFPLISSLDDFIAARQVVSNCLDSLRKEGLDHHRQPSVGMMVELPSVVETMPAFAREADFFAIGTNDFVQYMLGVDRGNERVAAYYRPEHPAVLRSLARVVSVAQAHNKPVSICGEMGHDHVMLPFLLGIGIRRLSLDPQFMPAVQKRISGLDTDECRTFAKALLEADSIAAVRQMLDPGLLRKAS